MMPTDDLFKLIKSLNKNEKRYFKLSASFQKGEKNYLKLFDAIDKQNTYDEKLIKEKLKGEVFIKQLTVTKTHLYRLVMDSLRKFHSNISIESQLHDMLKDAEILFDKLLYGQCEKVLVKAKAIAEKYEHHIVLLKIFEHEVRLIRIQSYSKLTEEENENMFKEWFSVIKKYNNIVEFNHLLSGILIRMAKEGTPVRTASSANYYRKIMNHVLFASEKNALSFRAKSIYYLAKDAYFVCLENFKNSCRYGRERVRLYETTPAQIIADQDGYQSSLKNLISSSNNNGNYEESFFQIEKLKKLEVRSKGNRDQNVDFINRTLVTAYINTGQFKKGVELISQKQLQEKGLGNMQIANEVYFTYCCAVTYIGAGDYLKAKVYLNKIVNEASDTRTDLYCFSKILNLIVHYEIGDRDMLEYAVESTYRYLYKRNRLYKLETVLLTFIRNRLPGINSSKELITEFKVLKLEIEKLIKDPFERIAISYFDFIAWLESKIEKRPFADCVRRRATSSATVPLS